MDDAEKMEESCRLCDEVTEKMYSVFDKTEEGFEVLQVIKECMPIIIYRTDPLSKQVCESCYNHLSALYTFKKAALETAERQKCKLKETIEAGGQCKQIQLFLACGEEPEEGSELKDAGTSTEDLTIYCNNCKQSIADGSVVNGELELCTDLHTAIAESMAKNKVPTESTAEEKLLRKRKVIPFYHELDDSLCSSLTEFTHATEDGSQCYDVNSDEESVDEDDESRPRKKRKLDSEDDENRDGSSNGTSNKGGIRVKKIKTLLNGEQQENYEKMFVSEKQFRFQPLSLLNLALNVINKQHVPDYEPEEYLIEEVKPKCQYCGKRFKNLKVLALHEQEHINVEVGEKIDHPQPWLESREDAHIRNKWLSYFDENGGYADDDDDDDDIVLDETVKPDLEEGNEDEADGDADVESTENAPETEGDSDKLLVHKESIKVSGDEKIILDGTQPMVNGVYLGDYSKEDRKLFYQTMRIQGVNKKFCQLCRYTFKDNWAIESHYFSSACYYTCRYCGMRFNKQRHKYDEHVQKHKERNDKFSDKIYAASKISNTIPKILQPPKPKKVVVKEHTAPQERPQFVGHQIRVKNFHNPANSSYNSGNTHGSIKIKEEPMETNSSGTPMLTTAQLKSTNQAYFCRKCYKVFFRLEEFNAHNQTCDFNQLGGRGPGGGGGGGGSGSAVNSSNRYSAPAGTGRNGEVSPSGRPVRNCAKEAGPYRDEVYLPDHILKEPKSSSGQQQTFVCFVCNTPFPTIYSRNSHMRIHKGEQFQQQMMTNYHQRQPHPPPQPPQHHIQRQQQHHQQQQQNHHQQHYRVPTHRQQQMSQNNYAGINLNIVKQEPMEDDNDIPMEPMVEIHESEPPSAPYAGSTIGDGAVSILPISKTPKPKPFINSNIMRMVQNNPNISIKPRSPPQHHPDSIRSPPERVSLQGLANNQQMMAAMAMPDDNRTYKCSSCWEAFSNKSHLYFHKKNQCEGSRLPCPFCKKRFGTEAEYSSHIYYSHPE